MAAHRKPRRRETQLAFEALSIEGVLLSPDWLARAAQLQAGQQSEAEYRIPKGLNLRDEIGRYWRIAQAHWSEFAAGLSGRADPRVLAERFVRALLRDSFGFASLTQVEPIDLAERVYPIGFSALGRRVPVVIAPAGSGLDTPTPLFGDGGRRRSAFGLAQEFLNAAEDAMWGLASDGVTLRILRDNGSMTRPAWIEADLGRIFTEERYADFAALWLLAHESRFGRPDQRVSKCPLETWRDAGRTEGTRAGEELRNGVEKALIAFGQGFLSHPDNQALHAALRDGSLTKEAYFQQLQRLVYRLIFLLTVEERGWLHPDKSSEAARKLYADGYSLRRLRERSTRRSAHDRFSDLWEATKIVFRGLADGEPRLALPALAGLFAKNQCPALDAAKLENRDFLLAIFRLSWLPEESGLSRVNWRDMGPEELGSVYESLLELVPQITQDRRVFAFATGQETKGNARKTTGSYYTPDNLVQELLDSALEPVVKSTLAAHPEKPVEALLELTVVDPACGSGHFLLAAARRLAGHVARLQANGTPSAPEYRRAMRQVVGRCIYGVDLNPMAVELCKLNLWMEAVEPGLPLTFLNSHIRPGNALLGTTPELMAGGIPDAAWEPIEDDDKKIASALKKRNKKAAEGQRGFGTLWSAQGDGESAVFARAVAELEAVSDADAGALARKESRWQDILESPEYVHQRLVADAWCAAFVWPKKAGPLAEAAPTNELWRQIRDGKGQPPPLTEETTRALRERYHFFHWHLAFPQVFARGGFDCVLGNPPWEHTELKEKEWFAERRPDIASARTGAGRKRMIAELQKEDPKLHAEFTEALREHDGVGHFLGNSGRYPLCGRGRINLYAVFAEGMRNVLGPTGRVGCVLPTGIATDDNTKFFFQDVVGTRSLASLFDFENKGIFFPAVHSSYKFCLFTSGRGLRPTAEAADFVFFAHAVEHLRDPERRFTLSPDDIALLNPNTSNCPIFRSRADAALTKAIYRRVPVLIHEGKPDGNPWRLTFSQGLFNMATDSHHFRTAVQLEAEGYRREGNLFASPFDRYLPLYEAKMIHQFDHRWATYVDAEEARDVTADEKADPHVRAQPRYWVREELVRSALPRRPELLARALDVPESSRPEALRRAFAYWLTGWSRAHGQQQLAPRWRHLLETDSTDKAAEAFSRGMPELPPEDFYRGHPLTEADLSFLSNPESNLEALAQELMERFSPGWLMGWRDICRSTDERTLIAAALPCVAVGHTLPLFFTGHPQRTDLIGLLACMSSFVTDFALRQKVGGTHITYNLLKQFPLPTPAQLSGAFAFAGSSIAEFVQSRALELLYTTEELRPLAQACGYEGPPFRWDEARRFQLRRELDAAFFHLYLPADAAGGWQRAEGESAEQLAELRRHFPTPRDAVAYILETFPIVKRKDEAQHGHYRTKEAILRVYDALATTRRTGQPYETPISPLLAAAMS